MGSIYSILNNTSIYHIRQSTRICLWNILIGILLLGGNNVYCQNEKGFDLSKLYNSAINKYLLDSSNSSVFIIYLEKPSFDPEYIVRVNTFKDSIILEVHSFKENYFSQLYGHIKKYNNAEFEPEVNHYSVLVSNRLMEKMHSMFSKTIHGKVDDIPRSEISVDHTNHQYITAHADGTNYQFILHDEEYASWKVYQPKKESMAFRAAGICSAIAVSLKNNNFNELNIIESIEKSGF